MHFRRRFIIILSEKIQTVYLTFMNVKYEINNIGKAYTYRLMQLQYKCYNFFTVIYITNNNVRVTN